MAIIKELIPLRARRRVIWLNAETPKMGRAVFESRDFVVTSGTIEDLNNNETLAGLAAIIFTQSSNKLNRVCEELAACATRLLNFDCRVIVRPAESGVGSPVNTLGVIERCVRELQLPAFGLLGRNDALPHVRLFDLAAPWRAVGNYVLEHPPGRPPAPAGELAVTCVDQNDNTVELAAEDEILIRRAFGSCSDAHLSTMDDVGRSGASVYRVYTELSGGHFGRWPLPYFVKLGRRESILAEYQNYQDHVVPYVPFHLGPHLVNELCCLSAARGLIVGNFVEESESFIRCARAGRAVAALACLFNRTLAGWYRSETDSTQPLTDLLGFKFPRKVAAARIERAKHFGSENKLSELRVLFNRCSKTPVVIGPIHGDLHGANVRVRATDAIVLDFLAHGPAPLVYDLAKLEASLLVDGFDDVAVGAIDGWFSSIRILYEDSPLSTAPGHCNPKISAAWFFSCVRQIRLYARRMETGTDQYAAALAVALLEKAAKDRDAPEPEASRRAAAYALSELVLKNTFGVIAENSMEVSYVI
jgi:hypothetical protein